MCNPVLDKTLRLHFEVYKSTTLRHYPIDVKCVEDIRVILIVFAFYLVNTHA